MVKVPALNVRSAPTLSGSVVTVLPQYDLVRVVAGPATADGYA